MDVKGKLYYGDNLEVLRNHISSESVDLIYLDPPFNSNATYNVLFKSPKTGDSSHSQIQAFDDTWHWGQEAQLTFDDLMKSNNTNVSTLIEALRRFLGENDMMAYLVMMTIRLTELHRVLKSTGSLYLHCDPTASHYLKLILDAVFGHESFRNEIIWKRKTGRGETNHKPNRFGNSADILLFYSKSRFNVFNPQFNMGASGYQEYIDKFFRFTDENGKRYQKADLTSPSYRQNLVYDYKGYPAPKKGWAISYEKMVEWDKEGRLIFPQNPEGRIRRKRYLDELRGMPIQNIWADIEMISSQSAERLGYPTQKPVALLERIIQASSNEGDTVLDPFCGCGTTIHAAQKLKRNWIGIDITHLAISLIENRLKSAFPDVKYDVIGNPKDFEAARDLALRDKYQFQWWALSLVGAQPYQNKKRGADTGIDGLIFFIDSVDGSYSKVIVSVKGGDNIGPAMIRDLVGTMEREKASIGLFVTLAEPTEAMRREASARPLYESHLKNKQRYPSVQLLTIKGLLDGTEEPNYPDIEAKRTPFKKARIESKEEITGRLF